MKPTSHSEFQTRCEYYVNRILHVSISNKPRNITTQSINHTRILEAQPNNHDQKVVYQLTITNISPHKPIYTKLSAQNKFCLTKLISLQPSAQVRHVNYEAQLTVTHEAHETQLSAQQNYAQNLWPK